MKTSCRRRGHRTVRWPLRVRPRILHVSDGREVNPTRLEAALDGAGAAQQLRIKRLKSGMLRLMLEI